MDMKDAQAATMSGDVIDMEKLEKLAEVAVKVGLDLQKGQDLVITAPVAAMPLVRFITKHAYLAGGGLVTAFYNDEVTTLMRYQHGREFDLRSRRRLALQGHGRGLCQWRRTAGDFGRQSDAAVEPGPDKVARANRALSTAYKPALEKISNFEINWNIVSYPNPSWAKQMFPELRKTRRSGSSPMPSSPPPASMSPIRSRPGRPTMQRFTPEVPGSTARISPRCISRDRAPI